MITVISGKPTKDEKRQKTIFLQLLALLVACKPEEVNALLVVHGLSKNAMLSDKELVNLTLSAVVSGNVDFHVSLAQLFANLPELSHIEDSFNAEDYMNPLSMITGTIGSVANIIGNAQQAKMQKAQARNVTMQNLLAFKSQQQAAIARQSQQKAQADRNRVLIPVIGGTIIIGLIVFLSFFRNARQNRSMQVTAIQ
ncbi:MAG: hypothetical protein WBA74_03660 [Cyclobacteriaceae bacterium]